MKDLLMMTLVLLGVGAIFAAGLGFLGSMILQGVPDRGPYFDENDDPFWVSNNPYGRFWYFTIWVVRLGAVPLLGFVITEIVKNRKRSTRPICIADVGFLAIMIIAAIYFWFFISPLEILNQFGPSIHLHNAGITVRIYPDKHGEPWEVVEVPWENIEEISANGSAGIVRGVRVDTMKGHWSVGIKTKADEKPIYAATNSLKGLCEKNDQHVEAWIKALKRYAPKVKLSLSLEAPGKTEKVVLYEPK